MKKTINQLKAKIEKVDVVSFDIFDTLLVRTVGQPKDVFVLVQEYVNQQTGHHISQEFSTLRQQAEHNVFVREKSNCYTLDAIYEELQAISALSSDLCKELMLAERHIEQQVLRPRKIMKSLYEYARRCRKKIILTSDMYLSVNDVKKVLSNNGYDCYDQLILSSHDKLSKADGTVYEYLVTAYPHHKILHIGDNDYSDREVAVAFGVTTGRIPSQIESAMSRMSRDIIDIDISADQSIEAVQRNMISALLARRMEDESDESESYLVGYGIGAVLIGFVQWLQESARNDHITHLYFLARDGALMRTAYQQWYKNTDQEIPSTYTLASRRIYNLAALKDPLSNSDLHFLTGSVWGHTRVRDVFTRFGIDKKVIATYARQVDLKLNELLDTEAKRRKLRSLVMVAQHVFLDAAKKENAVVADYLRSIGMFDQTHPAVVDVGWHGTLQDSLQTITGRELGGYYFGLEAGTDGPLSYMKSQGYIGQESLERQDLFATPGYVTIIEQFFTNPNEKTMIGIQKKGVDYTAVNSDVRYSQQAKDDQAIRNIQAGALDFMSDYRDALVGMPRSIQTLTRSAAMMQIFKLIDTPTAAAAHVFGRLFHFDGYGKAGSRLEQIGYPKKSITTTLSRKQFQRALYQSYWREGFIKNSRRPGGRQ